MSMCVSCCTCPAVLAGEMDSCTVCLVMAASPCLCVTVLLADLDRSLRRCLPTLPCQVRLRALASCLKGEVALMLGILDSGPTLLDSVF